MAAKRDPDAPYRRRASIQRTPIVRVPIDYSVHLVVRFEQSQVFNMKSLDVELVSTDNSLL